MQEEESGLGSIKIHNAVIAQIAAAAIFEIDGVIKLAGDLRDDINKLFGRKDMPGIKVDINNNNDVRLDVFVIVKYGINIPEISSKIQENIKSAVEKMTNVRLLSINVNIQGVERGNK